MMKDQFFRLMLIVIAVLLFLNLVNQRIAVSTSSEALAQEKSGKPQGLDMRYDTGSFGKPSIACSSGGQYVYMAGESNYGYFVIYRSTNFGKPGSWEHVAIAR